MSEAVVLIDKQEGIATVTLNRPDKLNALNRELRLEFCRAMQHLRADPEVRAVIITGAGRAFCVGLDLRELGTGASGIRDEGNATFVTVIEDMEVPVIAAVNGFAVTGGFELALACDMIIAAEDAQFADTHARVGVMPGGGMSARLPRAVGIRKAKELSLTGNYLRAREAERMGLVNRVVAKEQLLTAARELATQIAGAPIRISCADEASLRPDDARIAAGRAAHRAGFLPRLQPPGQPGRSRAGARVGDGARALAGRAEMIASRRHGDARGNDLNSFRLSLLGGLLIGVLLL